MLNLKKTKTNIYKGFEREIDLGFFFKQLRKFFFNL